MSKEIKQLRAIKQFAKESTIPVTVGQPEKLNELGYNKMLVEQLGFEVTLVDGGLFHCKFPKGWKKYWDRSMLEWMYLLDEQGRKRAAIFYKFMGYLYENKKKVLTQYATHINWMPRYRIIVNHTVPFNPKAKDNSAFYSSPMQGVVVDDETVIYSTAAYELLTKKDDELYETEIKELKSKLYDDCEKWLKDKYPKYDIVSSYWDDL